MVNQHLLEPVGPVAPVLLQVEREVGCNDLAASVGHPASLGKFTHARVDQGHACHSVSPPLDLRLVNLPLVHSFTTGAILVE